MPGAMKGLASESRNWTSLAPGASENRRLNSLIGGQCSALSLCSFFRQPRRGSEPQTQGGEPSGPK